MSPASRNARVWCMAAALLLAPLAHRPLAAQSAKQVAVDQVQVAVTPVGPVVLLRVRDKAIPILVDGTVAESIQGALSGQKPRRPLTHDLMHTVIEGLGGRVAQVVVTLHEGTFHGALSIDAGKMRRVFDSRSSDAIALAIHFRAPILVGEDLVDAVGIDITKPGEVRS